MKRTLASLMFVGLMTTGAAAFAQDRMGDRMQEPAQQPSAQDQYSSRASDQSTSSTTTSSSKPKHEAMKDCVAREQASNSTMSKSDARKACHDQLKAQRDSQNSEPRPQQ